MKMNEDISNVEKVLDVFFDSPTDSFYVREIARITGLNPNTILNITRKLVDDRLIKKEKKKHVVEFSVNMTEKFKNLKRVSNLKKIYDSGLVEFLIEKFSPESISVIGSYSLGDDLKESDIDIVVITKKRDINFSLAKFEKYTKRKVHLIVTDYNSISDEFYVNLINGVVLQGFVRKK